MLASHDPLPATSSFEHDGKTSRRHGTSNSPAEISLCDSPFLNFQPFLIGKKRRGKISWPCCCCATSHLCRALTPRLVPGPQRRRALETQRRVPKRLQPEAKAIRPGHAFCKIPREGDVWGNRPTVRRYPLRKEQRSWPARGDKSAVVEPAILDAKDLDSRRRRSGDCRGRYHCRGRYRDQEECLSGLFAAHI